MAVLRANYGLDVARIYARPFDYPFSMKSTPRSFALEQRFPYLCKVIYFPNYPADHPREAPSTPLNWYLRAPLLPRVGDVIPYGQALFAVNTVILEDCHSADAISKVDKHARRVAEKEEQPKWHAVIWVSFWGTQSL